MIESMFLLSIICFVAAFIGLRNVNSKTGNSGGEDSYFHLVQTNIKRFNQRLFSILLQFLLLQILYISFAAWF